MDYRLRLDGALDELWEPLWQLNVHLLDAERALLRSKAVRRLHFIRHAGAFFINSHHTYSRLQHTLGVFALTVHFEPNNKALRVAALLHDTGHAPFSHTLESIEGVDHHSWTQEVVYSEEVVNILSQANIQPDEVMGYIEGTRRSLVRNKEGAVHADHLDSWVRSAYIGGYLPVSTAELLKGINYVDGNLHFTADAARHVLSLIWEEARMHGSPANIGVNTMLKKLINQLIVGDKLDMTRLLSMTDAHIEQLLLSDENTKKEYEQLLMESWRVCVTRDRPAVAAEITSLDKLYLAMPLVEGVSMAETSPNIATTINELKQMLGTYYVWWGEDKQGRKYG